MKNQLFIWALLFSLTSYGQYQNHSGLKNRKLRLVNKDNRQTFEEVQSGLPSDEKLPEWPPRGITGNAQSKLDSVVVLDDAPQHLTVLIYFRGINKAVVQANASSDTPQLVAGFSSPAIAVQQGQSPLELTLKAPMPENIEVQSKQLTLEIIDPQRINPNKSYIFSLAKRWNSQIKAENLKQIIKLDPIGAATSLWQMPANAQLPNPRKNLATNQSQNLAAIKKNTDVSINTSPKGPSKLSFSLWDNIQTDVDFELNDISSIRAEIHPDLNPASETFYISPVAYNLRWTQEDAFKGFKILYGANNDVQFYISLHSGITTKQIETSKYLIKKLYKGQNISLENPKIQLLGANSTPSISLKSDFQGVFQIDPSKVNVTVPNDFASPLQVSWTTDNKAKDLIVQALQNGIGLNGSLVFGMDSIMRQIPVSISFSDRRTYGKIMLNKENWRNAEWLNSFPFPIKIRFLHALLDEATGQSKSNNYIYSWNANGIIVPPNSKITFDATTIPPWFDGSDKVLQLWIDFEVEPCSSCTQQIITGLTSGLSGSSDAELRVQSMDLLATFNAKLVQIRVKSLQASPTKDREVERTANITQDGQDVAIGPFYVGADKKITYQYKVLILSNQANLETNWTSESTPQLFLNKALIEKLLSK